MDDRIITFRTYYDPIVAQIELSKLKDNDIPCFIADEHMAVINPFYNNATGGVRLNVFERDIARCEAILNDAVADEFETETLHNGADSAVICAHCGSKNVRYGYATNRKHNWWSVFIFAIIALAALSVRSFGVRKAWHCFNCGKDFE